MHSVYTTFVTSIIYFVFGSHRRLSFGFNFLVSFHYMSIIQQRMLQLNLPLLESNSFIQVSMCTLFIGLFSLLASILQLGPLVRFVSHEAFCGFRAGYLLLFCAIQFQVLTKKKMTEIIDYQNEIPILPRLFHNLNEFKIQSVIVFAAIIGGLCLYRALLHFLPKMWKKTKIFVSIIEKIPIEFLLCVGGILLAGQISENISSILTDHRLVIFLRFSLLISFIIVVFHGSIQAGSPHLNSGSYRLISQRSGTNAYWPPFGFKSTPTHWHSISM